MRLTVVARSILVGVVLTVVVGCSAVTGGSAGIATGTPPTTVPLTTTVRTTGALKTFHPSGFRLPQGVVRTTADIRQGRPSLLALAVGDVVELPTGEWLPDNEPYSTALGATLVLAAEHHGVLRYQAVRAGKVTLAIGPVGHPGGCDQPGKNCADATPPPLLDVVVG